MSEFRTERDSMGEVRVPARAYYGAQTQRAKENFPISGWPLAPNLIHALGLVKYAAAVANRDLGKLTGTGKNPLGPKQVDALLAAAREVVEGKLDGEFPIDVFQTGSGTSSNMNANEVIANRAIELLGGDRFRAEKPIHPNDHVNMGQSTNDMFPTAIHVAVAVSIERELKPALERFRAVLADKAQAWNEIIKIGRTHLADATPIRLGQEFSGYARQLELSVERAARAVAALARTAGRRHGRGHRHQYSPRVRPPRGRSAGERNGHRFRRSSQSLRSQRQPRRSGRVQRPTAHRSPRRCSAWPTTSAGWAAARAAGFTKSSSPIASPARRSCRARSTP